MIKRISRVLSLALALVIGSFGLAATPAPEAALKYAGPFLAIAPAPMADIAETSILMTVATPALAWNDYTWIDGYGACGANAWCTVSFYNGGGSDRWDYIRIDYQYSCSGSVSTQSHEGGYAAGRIYRGFWNGQYCHSTYAIIWSYDNVYDGSAYMGEFS